MISSITYLTETIENIKYNQKSINIPKKNLITYLSIILNFILAIIAYLK
jgi:hypothetical protein